MESVNIAERSDNKSTSLSALSALLALASVALAVFHGIKGDMSVALGNGAVSYAIGALAALAGVVLIINSIKNKKYMSAVFGIVQVTGFACFVVLCGGKLDCMATLSVDHLASTMIAVTGLMGAIVMWRTGMGITVLVSVLGVDGLVLSDDLMLMYLFWNILAVSSYALIKRDGKHNEEMAGKMLSYNVCAGLGFVVGIVVSGIVFETVDISAINLIETVYSDLVAVPAIFIVLAGMIRAMQMPFQGWFATEYLTSAGVGSLIQAITMVNSGVLVVIKMAPTMGISNFAGLMAIIVGAVTFFISSLNAVTETNVRKMLTESTAATMGLIIVCAGIGTSESIWAAIMLLVFHTVAKPLILAGTEYPKLRTDMVMAVIVMMIAPFAIVLLRRESMGSIADTGNIILIIMICFSGAMAVFYWTKWLGRLIAEAITDGIEPIKLKEFNPMKANAWLLILLIVGFPVISRYMVVPYMEGLFGGMSAAANLTDSILGSVVIALAVALAAYPIYKGIRPEEQETSAEDDEGQEHDVREMIMQSTITIKIRMICGIVSIGMIVICVGFIIVNLIGLLGGVV